VCYPSNEIKFAKDFGKLFHDNGMNAAANKHGVKQRTVSLKGNVVML
jgi:hypothetical protein